jgi:hypothetical protein
MFRAANRSSSGTLIVFAVFGFYAHMVTGRCQGCRNSLELLMMSGVPLET